MCKTLPESTIVTFIFTSSQCKIYGLSGSVHTGLVQKQQYACAVGHTTGSKPGSQKTFLAYAPAQHSALIIHP